MSEGLSLRHVPLKSFEALLPAAQAALRAPRHPVRVLPEDDEAGGLDVHCEEMEPIRRLPIEALTYRRPPRRLDRGGVPDDGAPVQLEVAFGACFVRHDRVDDATRIAQ